MKKTVRLTENDVIKLVRRVINEGFIPTENPKSLMNRINMEQNKTAVAYVKNGLIVFKFKDQEIGLDCTAADLE